MKRRFLGGISGIALLIFSAPSAFAAESTMCAQVITPAVSSSGECREFPTPCEVPSGWKTVANCSDEDISLEELENSGSSVTAPNFQLKSFASCSQMGDVLSDFVEKYYQKNPRSWYGGPMPLMMEDAVGVAAPVSEKSAMDSVTSSADSGQGGGTTGAKDFSQTNVQIAWVDESEIVKTDGSYAYFYNSADHRIYISDVRDAKNVSIVKKIKVPDSYGNPEIYVGSGKLVLFSNKYAQYPYAYRYWFDRTNKSVVVVYDISNPSNPKIERYFQIDGSVTKTRRVGQYLYILSNAGFSFPYDRYFVGNPEAKYPYNQKLDTAKIDRDFSVSKVMPKKVELSKVSKNANFRVGGKLLPYRYEAWDAASCTDTEYLLPDEKTMEKYSFSPTFTTLSAIDLSDSSVRVKTKVFFGDVGEIMMTPTALYLTSQLYSDTGWKCPAYARCFAPSWNSGYETLVHKLAITGLSSKYVATAVVPGMPLNQYSMDEGVDGNFRIVTSETGEKSSTRLSILDRDLVKLGTISGIAPGETFQSSRFIGDRLYLVTFERIDPLFVVNLSDAKNPKIEGELKIPGYSTYLHPYAPGKLIGIGYDTITNQWGGTQNSGVKIDLYDVADVKNPKRLSTRTLGGVGSSSDALWNPRVFVWNASKKLLLLPATLMEPSKSSSDPYRYSDAFQGTVALSIAESSGITEVGRVSHIVKGDIASERKKDCAQYTVPSSSKCEKLVGGGEYCPSGSSYIPPYCYESSSDGEYFASRIWNYSNAFVLRNLYLDSTLYTFSNTKMVGSDLSVGGLPLISETSWK